MIVKTLITTLVFFVAAPGAQAKAEALWARCNAPGVEAKVYEAEAGTRIHLKLEGREGDFPARREVTDTGVEYTSHAISIIPGCGSARAVIGRKSLSLFCAEGSDVSCASYEVPL